MKKFLHILVLLIVSQYDSLATYQTPDILIWNNDTLEIYYSPLENNTKITKSIFNLNKSWESSGCYRGYIATWIIIDNKLYLKNAINNKDKSSLNSLFEDILKQKFSDGKLFIPNLNIEFYCGKNPIWMMPIPFYEKEFKLKIQNGQLVQFEEITLNECQYKYESESLKQFIYSRIDWNNIEYSDRQITVEVEIDSVGKILSCKSMEYSYYNEKLFNEAVKVIKQLPCLKVYSLEGKAMETIWISVLFNKTNRNKYAR